MKYSRRSVLILLALLSSLFIVAGQDTGNTDTITVVGSAIVNPLLQQIIAASETDMQFDISTTGSAAGFQQLCAGTADIATASQPMSVDESAACRSNEIEVMELLIGHQVLALIGNPQDIFAACLTTEQVNTIFAPSAAGQIANWNQLNETSDPGTPAQFSDLALQVLVPEDTTLTFAQLDGLVSGVGLREDATVADFETIIETVRTTSGAIGAVPYELIQANPEVLAVAIGFADTGCITPSVDFAEAGVYPAATPLLVYVNKSLQESLGDFLTFLAGDSSATTVIETGFSAPSAAAYETNRAILAGEQESRTVSIDEAQYQIPAELTGSVSVGGALTGFPIADTNASNLTANQPNLTINRAFGGETADTAALCSGELDLLFVSGDALPECDPAVETLIFPLGAQAAVLVANAEADYAACLTTTQINTIWGAAATDIVTNWHNIAESMPDQPMTLFGIRAGNPILSDILLTAASGTIAQPVRTDTEIDNDPLYRAAAVANVEGALTYMSWGDFQQVVARGQERIQLVLVDGGSGCVQPSEDTIFSGEYPLARSTTLVVNKASLSDVAVQSYLWTIFSDPNFNIVTSNDFVGVDRNDFAAIRDTLLVEYEVANALTAEATAEATAEVTPEATAESTPQAGD